MCACVLFVIKYKCLPESDIFAIACVTQNYRPNLNGWEKAYFYGTEFPFQSPECVDINQ